jgi:ATP-binding cassette subfamily F protein uup
VSHDRAFLNNIVTSTLILDGSGAVNEYVGGYDDWRRQIEPPSAAPAKPKPEPKADAKPAARKLSYKEKRELEELPKKIELLEAEQHALSVNLETPEFYLQASEAITTAVNRLQELQEELSRLYRRWEELEA